MLVLSGLSVRVFAVGVVDLFFCNSFAAHLAFHIDQLLLLECLNLKHRQCLPAMRANQRSHSCVVAFFVVHSLDNHAMHTEPGLRAVSQLTITGRGPVIAIVMPLILAIQTNAHTPNPLSGSN